jgi:hypothetical protein
MAFASLKRREKDLILIVKGLSQLSVITVNAHFIFSEKIILHLSKKNTYMKLDVSCCQQMLVTYRRQTERKAR